MIALDHHAQLNNIVCYNRLFIYLHLSPSTTSLAIVSDYNTKPLAIPPYPRLRTRLQGRWRDNREDIQNTRKLMKFALGYLKAA
jgi:hypothetical protein